MTVAYFNGSFAPIEQIKISPLDRGYLFGDGVYEVVPSYGAELFCLDQHLDRLEASLDAARIRNPYTRERWRTVSTELSQRNGVGDQLLYIQVTRGAAPRQHGFPDCEPSVFAMVNTWPRTAPPLPATAITVEDNRWQRCDIKSVALLANVLLRQDALDRGATESILVRDGYVTEGAASNVFVVTAGEIRTPPKSTAILAGITRDIVIGLVRGAGLEMIEEPVPQSALLKADEIWITSSSLEIRPVVSIDDCKVGNAMPGAVWTAVYKQFCALTRERLSEVAAG